MSAHFVLLDDLLYERDFSFPLLQYIRGEEATYILYEIHKDVCVNYSRGLALARKVPRQGYYWPALKKDAI